MCIAKMFVQISQLRCSSTPTVFFLQTSSSGNMSMSQNFAAGVRLVYREVAATESRLLCGNATLSVMDKRGKHILYNRFLAIDGSCKNIFIYHSTAAISREHHRLPKITWTFLLLTIDLCHPKSSNYPASTLFNNNQSLPGSEPPTIFTFQKKMLNGHNGKATKTQLSREVRADVAPIAENQVQYYSKTYFKGLTHHWTIMQISSTTWQRIIHLVTQYTPSTLASAQNLASIFIFICTSLRRRGLVWIWAHHSLRLFVGCLPSGDPRSTGGTNCITSSRVPSSLASDFMSSSRFK